MFDSEKIYNKNLETAKNILSSVSLDIDENIFNELVENDLKKHLTKSDENKADKIYDGMWKEKAYMWKLNNNPYVSDTKTEEQYKKISTDKKYADEKKELNDFISNPANEETLRNIYKLNRSATLCANLYHQKRIDDEFDKLGNGFENTKFIPENDKGNCTKGLTAVLLKNIKSFGLLDKIPPENRNKECWAHPQELCKQINQTNDTPKPQLLNDFLNNAEDNLKRGMILVINGHHAMMYTGKKDSYGNPICCGFTPETANYTLKPNPNKNVYTIDIPTYAEKLDKSAAPRLIDRFVKETVDTINNGKIFGIFKKQFQDIQETKKEESPNAQRIAKVKTHIEKNKQSPKTAQLRTYSPPKMTISPQEKMTFLRNISRKR